MINLYHYTLRYRGLFGAGGGPTSRRCSPRKFCGFRFRPRRRNQIIRAAIWYDVGTTRAVRAYAHAHACAITQPKYATYVRSDPLPYALQL